MTVKTKQIKNRVNELKKINKHEIGLLAKIAFFELIEKKYGENEIQIAEKIGSKIEKSDRNEFSKRIKINNQIAFYFNEYNSLVLSIKRA
jgi:hypothetical protein